MAESAHHQLGGFEFHALGSLVGQQLEASTHKLALLNHFNRGRSASVYTLLASIALSCSLVAKPCAEPPSSIPSNCFCHGHVGDLIQSETQLISNDRSLLAFQVASAPTEPGREPRVELDSSSREDTPPTRAETPVLEVRWQCPLSSYILAYCGIASGWWKGEGLWLCACPCPSIQQIAVHRCTNGDEG